MSYNAELHVALWIVKNCLFFFVFVFLCSISDSVYYHFTFTSILKVVLYIYLSTIFYWKHWEIGTVYYLIVIVLELQSLH